MDTDADLHIGFREFEVRLARSGKVELVSAIPIERPAADTRRASAATSARSRPCSAAAPTIFSTKHRDAGAAAARRESRVLDGDVVGDHNGLDRDPLGELGRHLEVHDVARVVLHEVQHSGAGIDRFVASRIWSGVGEVKISPQTAASSIPKPTKPACSGSCPLPPPLRIATVPCGFGAGAVHDAMRVVDLSSGCAAASPTSDSASTSAGAVDELLHASSVAR